MKLFTSAKYLFPEIVDGKVRLESVNFGDYIYVDECKYVDRKTDTVYYVTSEGVHTKGDHTRSVLG